APVQQGLAASLAKPGGNITGMTLMAPQTAEKRLELLKLAVPRIKRVAVLKPPASQATQISWEQTGAVAQRLGVSLIALETAERNVDFVALLDQAVAQKADALLAFPFPLYAQQAGTIADLALKRRLPSMFFERDAVYQGVLMAYGPNIGDLFVRLAPLADKVLKGAKPGDIPIEQPTKFDFMINAATAKHLGIRISPELLLRADEVIQ
ncbi:MAG: ABC transporter substrate-binding protein, partial [Betaproteobacteria bacterium]|nr:ABC transporter substrate-binding protein [Betaproteobacteria bacterium]